MTQPDVPKPQPLTDRATRVTALVIIGRVHTGRGTSPDRLAREADALIPWLASGKLPEREAIEDLDFVALRKRFATGGTITAVPGPILMNETGHETLTPPNLGPSRRRWWKR